MHHRPFPDQVQSPAWQLPLHDIQRRYVDRSLELAIGGMKMRRWVIIEKHTDQDPVERADCWRFARLILASGWDYSPKSASQLQEGSSDPAKEAEAAAFRP